MTTHLNWTQPGKQQEKWSFHFALMIFYWCRSDFIGLLRRDPSLKAIFVGCLAADTNTNKHRPWFAADKVCASVVIHLAVCVDHRAQQLPGAPSSVHSYHAKDLQETQAPQHRGGKDVALAARWHHRHRRYQHDDVCRKHTSTEGSKTEKATILYGLKT